MPCLTDIVDEVIRREAAQLPPVEVPRAPDVRPAADELGPIPAIRPAVENVAAVVALLALVAGFSGVFA